MPKKANILPNLRLDIPDFQAHTVEFAAGSDKLLNKSVLLDGMSAVAEGFRVEIANQVSFPRQLTVVNGNALDRDGQFVTNEDDPRATRSVTLPGNGTFYIEIRYLEDESDSDSRAFWDPTYDNGTDTSGDALPDGREFNKNVATRISQDWEIVSPINTDSFEYVTDPSTTRIPIAVVTVAAGVISGGSTNALTSVIAESILSGADSVRLLNTRAMLDEFDLTLNPGAPNEETVTIVSNTRESGILVISGTTANNHDAGEPVLVADVSPAEFLDERVNGAIPDSGTEDARPFLWRGDVDRGAVLAVDPADIDNRSDVNLHNLKRYVDFLASQIQEIKWGANYTDGLGLVPPPTDFVDPKYYDAIGGSVGARSCTFSVGTGTTSWGDFNVSAYGTFADTLQAAHDALTTFGGVIYLKRGTYVITNTTVTFTKPVILIGEGRSICNIQCDGSTPAITLDPDFDGYLNVISNVSISNTDTTEFCVVIVDDGRFEFRNASIAGLDTSAPVDRGLFVDVVFSNGNGGECIEGEFTNTTFINCDFAESYGSVTANDMDTAVQFINCTFSGSALGYALEGNGQGISGTGTGNFVDMSDTSGYLATSERAVRHGTDIRTIPPVSGKADAIRVGWEYYIGSNSIIDAWYSDGGLIVDGDDLVFPLHVSVGEILEEVSIKVFDTAGGTNTITVNVLRSDASGPSTDVIGTPATSSGAGAFQTLTVDCADHVVAAGYTYRVRVVANISSSSTDHSVYGGQYNVRFSG